MNLLEMDLSVAEKVAWKSSEFVAALIKEHKGTCTQEEWQWLKLYKKASDYFWKFYNQGVEKRKLFLEEETKSWVAFDALARNIPNKFKHNFESL